MLGAALAMHRPARIKAVQICLPYREGVVPALYTLTPALLCLPSLTHVIASVDLDYDGIPCCARLLDGCAHLCALVLTGLHHCEPGLFFRALALALLARGCASVPPLVAATLLKAWCNVTPPYASRIVTGAGAGGDAGGHGSSATPAVHSRLTRMWTGGRTAEQELDVPHPLYVCPGNSDVGALPLRSELVPAVAGRRAKLTVPLLRRILHMASTRREVFVLNEEAPTAAASSAPVQQAMQAGVLHFAPDLFNLAFGTKEVHSMAEVTAIVASLRRASSNAS